MPNPARLPILAIVGRPNVGKSTLFNRFAGQRRSLVENRPGVTRDRIAEEVEIAGRRFLIVDTAGLDPEPDPDEALAAPVQAQADKALEQADALLFVVDGKSGRLPADEELARRIRRLGKPVSLLVNKVDSAGHDARVHDFRRLGFDALFAGSAEHGSGIWDALEHLIAQLPSGSGEPEGEGAEAEEGILRIALVGRPNVGKSSLLNRLAGEERAVVSEIPGTTRDSIDLRIERGGESYVLVDTAGVRRPGRRKDSTERGSVLMTVRALERADIALIVLDASEGATDQDAKVASLACEWGCACLILANKWDLVAGREGRAEEVRAGIRRCLRFLGDAPLLAVSARSGAGLEQVFGALHEVAEAGKRRIGTAELNRWLAATVAKHEPAMAQRGPRKKPVKFYYATQTGVRPPTFLVFCTDPAAVQTSYRRFLENRLREDFDLRGTPIRLRLRARRAD